MAYSRKYPSNTAQPGGTSDAWFQVGFTAQQLVNGSSPFGSASEAGPAATDAAKAPRKTKRSPRARKKRQAT